MGISQDIIERAKEIVLEAGATRLILFGSAAESPETARDLDLACAGIEGWALFEVGARLEEELRVPLDLVPLEPSNRFTELIERHGKVLA